MVPTQNTASERMNSDGCLVDSSLVDSANSCDPMLQFASDQNQLRSLWNATQLCHILTHSCYILSEMEMIFFVRVVSLVIIS